MATDLFGIPIGWFIVGTNRNDFLLEPTLQAVAARGLLLDVETLHLMNCDCQSNLTVQRCHDLGVTAIICAKRRPKDQAKKHEAKINPARARPKVEKPPSLACALVR